MLLTVEVELQNGQEEQNIGFVGVPVYNLNIFVINRIRW